MTSGVRALLPASLVLACALRLPAQSMKAEDLSVGSILVTPRDSPDPLFAKSVILVVRYSQNGALGLLINHRTSYAVSRILSSVHGASHHAEAVFMGGPVDLNAVLALSRTSRKPQGATEIPGDIYLLSNRGGIEKALNDKALSRELRIYLGYCGWGPGQLEFEARRGGWYIFAHREALAFDDEPGTLWSRLVGEQVVRLLFHPPGTAE